MRPSVLMCVFAALFLPETSAAQIQFEGRVRGIISAEGMNVDVDQRMTGSKMRLDMNLPDDGQSVSQIFDATSGAMLMLLHEQRMWADMSAMSRFIPGFAAPASAPADVDLPDFQRTERVETIAGYECRHYILLMDGGDDVDVCAATGLGCFIPGAPAGLDRGGGTIPVLPQSADLWIEEFGDGFFILSMEAGGASYRALEVAPGAPPEEVFLPPSDYAPMEIPGF